MTRPIAALLLCGIAAALAVLLWPRSEEFNDFELDEPDEEGLFAPMAAWTGTNVAPMNTYTIHHHYGG